MDDKTIEERIEERPLTLEMPIEGALSNFGFANDVRDLSGVVTAQRDHTLGRVEQSFPSELLACVVPSLP